MVLEAIASNQNFVSWCLFNVGLGDGGDDLGLCTAQCLQRAPWVKRVVLTGNTLSSFALTAIVRNVLHRPALNGFRIQCAGVIHHDLLMACADLKLKFPHCRLGGGTAEGMLFESVVAMQCVKNPGIEEIVREGQRQLLLLVNQGDMAQAQDLLQKSKDEVIKPEHDRLLQLCGDLLTKYCVVGGLGSMLTLPEQKDEYAGAGAEGQFCPESMKHESNERRVRHLLAMASYKQPFLKDLLYSVHSDIHDLHLNSDEWASLVNSDEWASVVNSDEYTMPSLVKAFMAKHHLHDLTATLPAYKINVVGEDADVSGVYEFQGHMDGQPCCPVFMRKDIKLFLYRRDDRWRIGRHPGSFGATLLGPKDKENSKIESEGWIATRAKRIVELQLTECTCELKVEDELVHFLQRRAEDAAFRQLLTWNDQLANVVMGPPKGFARALEKGPDWLLDLNRGSILFDSPTLLVIAFHMLQARVESLGGRVTRLSNYFLQADSECIVGTINSSFKQPPCVHLAFRIDGWSYEVMLMLSDFHFAKETLHKYYEMLRAPDVMTCLMPVFHPTGDENTPCGSTPESYHSHQV